MEILVLRGSLFRQKSPGSVSSSHCAVFIKWACRFYARNRSAFTKPSCGVVRHVDESNALTVVTYWSLVARPSRSRGHR